jgi:YD repeat-containing protein
MLGMFCNRWGAPRPSRSVPSAAAPTRVLSASRRQGLVETPRGWLARFTFAARAFSFALLSLPAAAGIVYVYDESGRLTGLTDDTGSGAIYNYDSAGNLLSISPSTAVSIISFTPTRSPFGASVTIQGTGFSTNAGQNTVTFNGTTVVSQIISPPILQIIL